MDRISVIVGTPTYAIPPWLAAKYPDVIAVAEKGARKIRCAAEYGYPYGLGVTLIVRMKKAKLSKEGKKWIGHFMIWHTAFAVPSCGKQSMKRNCLPFNCKIGKSGIAV